MDVSQKHLLNFKSKLINMRLSSQLQVPSLVIEWYQVNMAARGIINKQRNNFKWGKMYK